MLTARFDYMFAGDTDCLYPELEARTGQRVAILSREDDDNGHYNQIKFSDGYHSGCNDDELTEWES